MRPDSTITSESGSGSGIALAMQNDEADNYYKDQEPHQQTNQPRPLEGRQNKYGIIRSPFSSYASPLR